MSAAQLLFLQRTAGNAALASLLNPKRVVQRETKTAVKSPVTAPRDTGPGDSSPLTKENVAAIVEEHLQLYEMKMNEGINAWSPPANSPSSGYFWVALAGNLVWACTCFVPPASLVAIAAMSLGGAAVGSGLIQKLSESAATPDSIKPNVIKQVGRFTDSFRSSMNGFTNRVHQEFAGMNAADKSAGWMDANKMIEERRKLAWNMMYTEKVAPWNQASQIAENAKADMEALWNKFDPMFQFQIVSLYGDLRYKGKDLEDRVASLYYQAMVFSGVADKDPAVKVTEEYKADLRQYKTYSFPSPARGMTGATVAFPTGKRAIPVELVP